MSVVQMTLKTENCKACGNCIRNCKKEAISFSDDVNTKGYRTIKVDMEKCIGCGMCYTVCPDYVFSIQD